MRLGRIWCDREPDKPDQAGGLAGSSVAWYAIVMTRGLFGLMLAGALSFSWAAPLCAEAAAPSHACCPGGEAPGSSSSDDGAPACCRAADAPPLPAAVSVAAPAPALPSSAVAAVEPASVTHPAPPRFVPSAPQAPPGTHSGLSPPSSGL